ncbi:MerR family transcriptional regulator [Agrilactobacillus yilanensis]|uniref:MerR family transcriptional regulator n=1 Tax=Agrilactobacillus yilanensis TaxID=2485997 RepID=A0ABW4J5H1_9LACO|nr:MerR family transcriptional regulator [Agrilactobacillus yilanensis]
MITIQEAGKRMALSPSAIRYYDRKHLIPDVQRDEHNNRVFQERDLIWIKMVKTLHEINMPINEIRDYVTLARTGKTTLNERMVLMTKQQELLLNQMKQAELRYVMASRWINHYVNVMTDTNLDKFPDHVNKDFTETLKEGFSTELELNSSYNQ